MVSSDSALKDSLTHRFFTVISDISVTCGGLVNSGIVLSLISVGVLLQIGLFCGLRVFTNVFRTLQLFPIIRKLLAHIRLILHPYFDFAKDVSLDHSVTLLIGHSKYQYNQFVHELFYE